MYIVIIVYRGIENPCIVRKSKHEVPPESATDGLVTQMQIKYPYLYASVKSEFPRSKLISVQGEGGGGVY